MSMLLWGWMMADKKLSAFFLIEILFLNFHFAKCNVLGQKVLAEKP